MKTPFGRDHQSAKVNALRTRHMVGSPAISLSCGFGDQYKQWNAAFDAGLLSALGKRYITLHDDTIIHALKEVDGAAMAWAKTPQQVVEILRHVTAE